MQGLKGRLDFPLSEVAAGAVREAAAQAEWDRLMGDWHYLGFPGMFGDGLRPVAAGPDGRWLRLVANNCRFLVLEEGRVPNLASRALASLDEPVS